MQHKNKQENDLLAGHESGRFLLPLSLAMVIKYNEYVMILGPMLAEECVLFSKLVKRK